MVQIQRVALFPNATFHIALARVFGLGPATSLAVSEACGISKDLKVKDVKDSYMQKVTSYIESNFVTGDTLRRQVRENVLAEVGINSRRGVRHTAGLPVTGAQTRNNGVNARKMRPLLMYDTSRR